MNSFLVNNLVVTIVTDVVEYIQYRKRWRWVTLFQLLPTADNGPMKIIGFLTLIKCRPQIYNSQISRDWGQF